MAEASPRFYRTQLVLTLVGTVFLLALCASLMREGSSAASVTFGVIFSLLIFLAAAMAVLRLMRLRVRGQRSSKTRNSDAG